MDDDLGVEQTEILSYVKENASLPKPLNSEDQITIYKNVNAKGKDSLFTQRKRLTEDEEEFRISRFYISIAGKDYEVEVAKSLENTDRIVKLVILITIITIVVLLLAIIILNQILLRRLWRPFNDSIKKIASYRLGQTSIPEFQKTDISEFQILNDTLQESISRHQNDYSMLQSFTENASHEMQTPVAIIHSKMDSLIQDENLSASQSAIVQEAYTALQRLTRLNKTLLLLTKIENNQYTATERIDLKAILDEKVLDFQDLMDKKNINFRMINMAKPNIVMNAGLADIMLNNLFNNCIKYNSQNGTIDIFLKADSLEFCNGPSDEELDDKLIFNRFYKSGNFLDQHGLGLAIVKEICNNSNFQIQYIHKDRQHIFKIQFPS